MIYAPHHQVSSFTKKIDFMRRKAFVLCASLFFASFSLVQAQLQQGTVMVGSDISHLDLSLNSGSNFSFTIDPKAAWFIKNNIAVGAYMHFDLSTAKDAGTSVDYGIGPLARLYFNDSAINLLRHGRFFIEANAGIEGHNPAVGTSTNGLGLGFGPGYAYFISPNIGFETLLKYQGIVGFGSSVTSSDLVLAIGFQIYINPNRVERQIKNEPKVK